MRKVLVFDSGWGGELFANYLERELPIIDVIKLIDWHNTPHEQYDSKTLRSLTEPMILPYIGQVDVIVLASYIVTDAALDWLREKYPQQAFLGFELGTSKISKYDNLNRLFVAADQRMLHSYAYYVFKQDLEENQNIKVVELDCRNWTIMIDGGKIPDRILRNALRDYDWTYDALALYNTHYIDVKPQLERMFGWRIRIIDDFKHMLDQISYTLRFNRLYLRPAGTLSREKRSRLISLEQQQRLAMQI